MNGMNGKVYLIGAGPGDYRLLTLKACDCLKMADTVVYDRLADERILQYAPRARSLSMWARLPASTP